MIKKASARNRFLTLALGITLGLAVVLTLVLMLVPEKEDRSVETQGFLLFEDGERRACTLRVQGTLSTYAFDKDAPIFEGSFEVDGKAVDAVYLTFDGDCAAPKTEGANAVLKKDMAFAAQFAQDGRTCLLLAPAADEAAAQQLLAQFLSDSAFARRQGWEAYQSK